MNRQSAFPEQESQLQPEKCWQKFFLRTWHPRPTLLSTILLFLIIGLIFIGLAILFIVLNNKILTYSVRYDNKCNVGQICEVIIDIKDDMKEPIFAFYQLDNFYQNHRRYIKSKSDKQLTGTEISKSTADTDCDPVTTNKEMGKTTSVTGTQLNPDDVAFPCGLVAKSYFTDTYQLFDSKKTQIMINEKDIAWPNDIGNKFKNIDDISKQWIDIEEDEHFAVWARISALKNFKKLWGRIKTDQLKESGYNNKLLKGTYTLKINNKYDSSAFSGKKYFILATAEALGGKNEFIAYAYLAVGIICILIGILFFIKNKVTGGQFGEDDKNK